MLDGALVVDDQATECAVFRCGMVMRQAASAEQDNDFFLSLDDDGHNSKA
jgi:hypothetical protein